jgi:predicted flap endonuclease-1-like 5' DNA nuclease
VRFVDLKVPDVDLKVPDVDLKVPDVDLKVPDVDLKVPDVDLKVPDVDLKVPDVDLKVPDVDLKVPDVDLKIPGIALATSGVVATASSAFSDWLASFDPHKPIVDGDAEAHVTVAPISMEVDSVGLASNQVTKASSMDVALDKPSVTKPVEISGSTSSGLFGEWFNKAKEAVEKASPVANELLHKAKDTVEHLGEKATPVANDWLHKAKDTVEHLGEKATPVANDWLHKAKEVGSEISSKGLSSATLAGIATKLSTPTSQHRDDFQKLSGIDVIMENVLHKAGIHSYQQLAEAPLQRLQGIVETANIAMSETDLKQWAAQAKLAASGEWDKLATLKSQLKP